MEQNMGKEDEKEIIKNNIFKCIDFILNLLIAFGIFIIIVFHKIGPFFPVLFLFDFCFWFGHPLFLKYVLKRKWFECTKNFYLKIKYILLPCLIMELVILLYYHKATYFIIKTVMENSN